MQLCFYENMHLCFKVKCNDAIIQQLCLSFDLCPQEAENEYDKWANQGEQEESYDDYQYGGGYGTCPELLVLACRLV